jgi:RimJ/RimL family protein N-acetyltransferase
MFAVTERLLLRPGWNDDAPALTKAVANEKIARNLAQLPWPYREEHAREFLSTVHGKGIPEFLMFTRHGEPQLIGAVGLHADPLDPTGPLELGYWIAEAQWGKGYATEAGHAVINIARWTLKLPRITSAYFQDNPASGRVLTKLGFKSTGRVVQRHSVGRGRTTPCQLMTLSLADSEKTGGPTSMWPSRQMQMAA